MKSKISKILGIGLSTGLVVGLIGAVFTAPVSADMMKWSIVSTPTVAGMVILPESNIIDYDIGGDEGDTIYAVLEWDEDCIDDWATTAADGADFALVKSTDGGVTWSDITAKVVGAANLPAGEMERLVAVAVAPDDEDWVAVAGIDTDGTDSVWVVASQDGGTHFSYTGQVIDTGTPDADTMDWEGTRVFDLAVSPEVDSIHNIVIAGMEDDGEAALFRLKAGTWLSASWDDMTEDATNYPGWDFGVNGVSDYVIAIAISPNFDIDDTIVIIIAETTPTGAYPVYYLQSGIMETNGSWASEAGFPNAAEIKADGDTLALWGVAPNAYVRCAGLTLPADYDGSDPGARAVFLYVNAILDPASSMIYGGYVFRADNNALSPVCGPPGDPLLASIDVHGDADTGKLMIGEYIQFDNDATPTPGDFLYACCCPSVRVWHTEELDFCCPQWDGACKDPSGPYMALVMYTPDGAKEYATTSGLIDPAFFDTSDTIADWYANPCSDGSIGFSPALGTPGDESAFSVSRDDAVSFNQIGLIDTDIDHLSDFVACPDCGTYYLSTMNTDDWDPCSGSNDECFCDSVWRSYDEGDTWERIFFGDWANERYDRLMLRIPCDAIEDCCDQDPVSPSGTVYLGIQDGSGGNNLADDDLFYSRDCGQCWNTPPVPKVDLQDFTVESENIVYAIDDLGYITISTQYGRRWSDPVDTGLDSSHMVLACCDEGFVVVTPMTDAEKVAWTDDAGDTWNLTAKLPNDGATAGVHVACDPVCENIIYVATDDSGTDGNVYRTDLTDGEWTKISIVETNYTGIAVAREGTLYAASDRLNFDTTSAAALAACKGRLAVDADLGDFGVSGVARNLTPCDTACCGMEDWDYLICGLTQDTSYPFHVEEDFDAQVNAIDLCGCLTTDTNTKLFAIDSGSSGDYDEKDSTIPNHQLWVYEDCAAKLGPELTSPEDGAVLDCEPCAGCDAANFTLKWERICLACSYDVKIMDEAGNIIVEWVDVDIVGDPPTLFVDGTMDSTTYYLECGNKYTWKVRMANTDCECVHSPWSETWSFTIAVGAADAISLLAPTKGAMDVPIESIGFSWTAVRNASSYSFVLSPNADLTGALVSQDLSGTAFNYAGPLDYSTAYYWQIIAWEDGTRLTTSAIGVFNTMAEPEEPPPPVVVEEQPAPVINIPPAEQITPTWIYAIIGIGAALAVVVIVLIVRTRRP